MKHKPKVAIFSTQQILPVNMGTAYSIVDMASHLASEGFDVHIIMRQEHAIPASAYHEAEERGFKLYPTRSDFLAIDYEALLEKRLSLALGDLYPGRKTLKPQAARKSNGLQCPTYRNLVSKDVTQEIARHLQEIQPDIMIVSYAQSTPLFALLPNPDRCLKVVLSIDIFQERKKSFQKDGLIPGTTMTKAEEAYYLRRADMAVAITDSDRKKIQEMAPDLDVITAGVSFTPSCDKSAGNHRAAIAAGAVDHTVHGTTHFIKKVWPEVIKRVPDATLEIFGELAQHVPSSKGVKLRGFVPSLNNALAGIPVFINPARIGSGLKISTMEALAMGKAVVTTKVGSSGLPINKVLCLCKNDDEMVSKLAGLFNDSEKVLKLQKKAYKYAEKHLAPNHVYADLTQYFRANI